MQYAVNQTGPVNANAGNVTNQTQTVIAPFYSTNSPTDLYPQPGAATSAAAAAQSSAVNPAVAATPTFLGLDPMTWLTIISILLYVGFTLEGK